jgi:hypothetical protein
MRFSRLLKNFDMMKAGKVFHFTGYLFILFCFIFCGSTKKIAYLQNSENFKYNSLPESLLDQAILQLRSMYDYIIINSAPVGAVIGTLIPHSRYNFICMQNQLYEQKSF